MKKVIDYWRFSVFIVRARVNHSQLRHLTAFLDSTPLLHTFAEAHPCVYEQATRQFFYKGSTPAERVQLIIKHLRFCTSVFTEEAFRQIYLNGGMTIWSEPFQDDTLSFRLLFNSSLKKEGVMVMALNLGETRLYHIDFWLDMAADGSRTLHIGALQGIEEGLPLLGALGKHFNGYRPKNLILRAVRLLAEQLKIDRIYAVADAGHHTNNHVRLDKKVKTSFDKFWSETGGHLSSDPRFFELDKVEPQKNIEDIKSSKRSQYRKRFAMFDAFDAEVGGTLNSTLAQH
jgi:uncharacterized protein VirK/YbjX